MGACVSCSDHQEGSDLDGVKPAENPTLPRNNSFPSENNNSSRSKSEASSIPTTSASPIQRFSTRRISRKKKKYTLSDCSDHLQSVIDSIEKQNDSNNNNDTPIAQTDRTEGTEMIKLLQSVKETLRNRIISDSLEAKQTTSDQVHLITLFVYVIV